MKKNRTAMPAALLLALALSACGGGTETAPATDAAETAQTASTTIASSDPVSSDKPADNVASPAPTPVPPAPPASPTPVMQPVMPPVTPPMQSAEPITIEYYGDSTVWGYRTHTGGQVAKPAPAAFAESLPFPSRFDVRNEGVSATTACDLLNGSDGRHPAWSVQMANSKAKYVLVNHAINDQWRYDVATYKACLSGLATGAKQHGKTMIFETPNPTRDSGSWGLDVYVTAMKEVAAQQNVAVIDQYRYLTDRLAGQSPYVFCPDGLHPTQEVYILKGQYAAAAFSALID